MLANIEKQKKLFSGSNGNDSECISIILLTFFCIVLYNSAKNLINDLMKKIPIDIYIYNLLNSNV